MEERQRAVVDVLLADPAVASRGVDWIGVGYRLVVDEPRLADAISLKPLAERGISSEAVIARLREPLQRSAASRPSCSPHRICAAADARAARNTSSC